MAIITEGAPTPTEPVETQQEPLLDDFYRWLSTRINPIRAYFIVYYQILQIWNPFGSQDEAILERLEANSYYQEWVSLGNPPIEGTVEAPTYESVKGSELSPDEKFTIIAQDFPNRLREWLTTSVEEGGGIDWVAALDTVAGITILPNGQYWDSQGSHGPIGFLDAEFAEQVINEARGVEEEPDVTVPFPTEDPGEGREWAWDGNQWIAQDIVEEEGLPPEAPEGTTFDPNTGIYTFPNGKEYYYDLETEEFMPVTPSDDVEGWPTNLPPTAEFVAPGVFYDPETNQYYIVQEGIAYPITEDDATALIDDFQRSLEAPTEVPGLPPEAQEVVPGQIYQLPDGSYVNQDGYPIAPEDALPRIQDYEDSLSGAIPPMPTEPPAEGYIWEYDHISGEWVERPGILPTAPGEQPIEPYQQAQLDLQEQQLAQSQAQFEAQRATERERYLANLRAQPVSWLEYLDVAGEQAAVQPWMVPLMRGQYAGLEAGAPLPGWPTGQPTEEESFTLGDPRARGTVYDPKYDPAQPTGGVSDITGQAGLPTAYNKEAKKRLDAMYKHILERIVSEATGAWQEDELSGTAEEFVPGGGYMSEDWWALPMEEKARLQEEAERLAREEYLAETGEEYWYPPSYAPSQRYAVARRPTAQEEWQSPLGRTTQERREYDPSQLPELIDPSVQYQARIGPTAEQQFFGYRQARTGAPPLETQFRLWSKAPASLGFGRELAIRR